MDTYQRALNVDLTSEEIFTRMENLPAFEPKITKGWLGRYADQVTSADTGAVMKNSL